MGLQRILVGFVLIIVWVALKGDPYGILIRI
jgi:hypothetical protein